MFGRKHFGVMCDIYVFGDDDVFICIRAFLAASSNFLTKIIRSTLLVMLTTYYFRAPQKPLYFNNVLLLFH
jgi:hypothetical protein